MKRIFALMMGTYLSALLIVPMHAIAATVSENQQTPKGGMQTQVKPASKAAQSWNEREKKRSATKKRAAAMKEKQLSKESGNKVR